MLTIALAVLIALMVWWVSTGVILFLDGLPRGTYSRSMTAATGLLGAGLYGVVRVRDDLSAIGAYIGFGCGIVIWGWLEMSFLMGYLTGSRRSACPAGCSGWRHFFHAIQAILYHELAILTLLGVVTGLSWSGGNHVAAGSLAILWAMRASAKLNLFFGVRNLSTELLPADLAYLSSFFRRQPMNFLFPFSVTVGTVGAVWLTRMAFATGATEFDVTSASLLATLTILGILEHWMLVLPFPATALWSCYSARISPRSSG